MAQKKRGERVQGPYSNKRGGPNSRWRVFLVDEEGRKSPKYFTNKKEAETYAAILRNKLTGQDTLNGVLYRYEKHLMSKGNKRSSISTSLCRIKAFFGDDTLPIYSLTIQKLRKTYRRRVGEVKAVDTHRNELAETKTLLRWCFKKGLVSKALVDRLDEVEGTGRRRKGKKQLRVDEARRWTEKALELAQNGDSGAVAALCSLYLGLRATEIVNIAARDVDNNGKLLWVTVSKTEAGIRRVEVPDNLQEFLLRLANLKEPDELIFGKHWRDWPRHQVQRICKLAEVPMVTAHGMRGLHATLARSAGATSDFVAASLGQTNSRVTEEHYISSEATQVAKGRAALRVLDGGKAKGSTGQEAAQEAAQEAEEGSESEVKTVATNDNQSLLRGKAGDATS